MGESERIKGNGDSDFGGASGFCYTQNEMTSFHMSRMMSLHLSNDCQSPNDKQFQNGIVPLEWNDVVSFNHIEKKESKRHRST